MAFPTIYIDTGGSTTNSGSSDSNSADLTGSAATVSGAVVTLDGSPDLSGVVTDGSATIYINDATNTNIKVFKITAVDDGADTVTVDPSPTGVTSSSWAIGGRFLASSGSYDTALSGAVTAGWTVQFNNSPASHSGSSFITVRNSGNNTDGPILFQGVSGSRPVLSVSSTDHHVFSQGSGADVVKITNLELRQTGLFGDCVDGDNGWLVVDCDITDAGGSAVECDVGMSVLFCEISGCVSQAVLMTSNYGAAIFGNYIHDNSYDGVRLTASRHVGSICHNVFDTCSGDGINIPFSGDDDAHDMIVNNTVYGCGNGGLSAGGTNNKVFLYNNIFMDNGNSGSEYNVYWNAGSIEAWGDHGFNVFHQSGGGGGSNLNGLTANATESTSDPLFTDAANGDFSISSSSSAKAIGFPGTIPGGTSTGYMDAGAIQRQEPAGGGGSSFDEGLHPIDSGVLV